MNTDRTAPKPAPTTEPARPEAVPGTLPDAALDEVAGGLSGAVGPAKSGNPCDVYGWNSPACPPGRRERGRGMGPGGRPASNRGFRLFRSR